MRSIVLFLILGIFWATPVKANCTCDLLELKGEVTVNGQKYTPRTPLNFPCDTNLKAHTEVTLKLKDGSFLTLDPESEISLTSDLCVQGTAANMNWLVGGLAQVVSDKVTRANLAGFSSVTPTKGTVIRGEEGKDRIAKVLGVTKGVKWKDSFGEQELTLQSKHLSEGDIITDANGKVQLQLEDGRILFIGPNSRQSF